MKLKPIFISFSFLMLITISAAQINKIDEELKKDKKTKSKSNNSTNSNSGYSSSGNSNSSGNFNGISAIYFIFRGMGQGIYFLQKSALEARKEHREIVSMEALLYSGYDSPNLGVLITPQARLNWGIFSTEFRQQRITDGTGLLETFDWQVLKFNIPMYPVTLGWGMGFSKVPAYDLSYFEYSLYGKARIIRERGLVELAYRSTEKVNNRWFRRELKTSFDYELKRFSITENAKIRISPMVGFVYQNYFASFNQFYVIGGLNIRFW